MYKSRRYYVIRDKLFKMVLRCNTHYSAVLNEIFVNCQPVFIKQLQFSVKYFCKLIMRQCCHRLETNQLTCTANQWTGFYMMATVTFNGFTGNFNSLSFWFYFLFFLRKCNENYTGKYNDSICFESSMEEILSQNDSFSARFV